MKKYFRVVKVTDEKINIKQITNHCTDRENRFSIIKLNSWKTETGFVVDKHHPNGDEIHFISCNAEIIIVNANTKKVITCLLPRPAQLERYYSAIGKQTPKGLLLKAEMNCKKGYNQM